MDKFLIGIGNRLYERRKHLRITQEKLAELIDVTPCTISNAERGRTAMKIKNIVKLCKVLNISIDYILTGKKFNYENNGVENNVTEINIKA